MKLRLQDFCDMLDDVVAKLDTGKGNRAFMAVEDTLMHYGIGIEEGEHNPRKYTDIADEFAKIIQAAYHTGRNDEAEGKQCDCERCQIKRGEL